jgi:hypothetical protein
MNGISTNLKASELDRPLLDGLFGPRGGDASRASWQVAHRSGHILALARADQGGLATALRWYRALRPAGRAFRRLLTVASCSPAWRMLPVMELPAGPDGFLARFEKETGRKVTAMLFGNPVQEHRRVILRAERPGERPWVVKVGFSAEAIEAIEREHGVLTAAGGRVPGVPQVAYGFRAEGVAAMATLELSGEPLWNPDQHVGRAVSLLRGLTSFGERRPLGDSPQWERIVAGWPAIAAASLERLRRVTLAKAFTHGDFAAWNLLVGPGSAGLQAVDWEWADPDGVAGWDLVHFFCQDREMVRRYEDEKAVLSTLACLREPEAAAYLAECGWPTPELALATYACALNPIFRGPAGRTLESICKGAWD